MKNTILFFVLFCIILSLVVFVSFQGIQTRTQQFDSQLASLRSQLRSFVGVKIFPIDKDCVGKACGNLESGSSGEDVKILQMFLKKYPELYPEGTVSGFYDGYTEAAVKRLQMQCNVKPNGVISPKVVHVMKEVYVCDVLEVCGILVVGSQGGSISGGVGTNKLGVLTVGPCPPEQ